MPRSGRKEVTTRMPVCLAEALRQRAQEAGLTVNDYVIGLLEADLAHDLRMPRRSRTERVRQAQAALRNAVTAGLSEALTLLDDQDERPALAS